MYQNVRSLLTNWNSTTTERQKLQHTYLLVSIVVVFVAGIISLFNADLGHKSVLIALFAIVAFLTNAIVWNLLKSSVISKLPSRPKRK
jgi:cell division protein FtsW (lipid II flippase)